MKRYFFALVYCVVTLSNHAFSETNTASRYAATAFLRADGGYSTFKSELVGSNDTGIAYSYMLGFHAGAERNIGIFFSNDSTTIAFELNDAKLTSSWQDTIIRYRMGAFHLGGVLSRMTMEVEPGTAGDAVEEVEMQSLDIVGTGFGAQAGFILGFGRNNAWFFDMTSVSIGETREANKIDVSIGNRMDIDTGVVFFLTRQSWDLILGYKMRSYTVDTTDTFAEAQSLAYLGIKLNSFF